MIEKKKKGFHVKADAKKNTHTNLESFVAETKAPCCLSVFRRACLGDSSHPVCVTGPFIFPPSEGPYLPWPATALRCSGGTSVTLQLSPARNPPPLYNTHTHTHCEPSHASTHRLSLRTLGNPHVPAITDADNRPCLLPRRICIPTTTPPPPTPSPPSSSSSSSSESLGHVLFLSPLRCTFKHGTAGSSETFIKRSFPGGD